MLSKKRKIKHGSYSIFDICCIRILRNFCKFRIASPFPPICTLLRRFFTNSTSIYRASSTKGIPRHVLRTIYTRKFCYYLNIARARERRKGFSRFLLVCEPSNKNETNIYITRMLIAEKWNRVENRGLTLPRSNSITVATSTRLHSPPSASGRRHSCTVPVNFMNSR